MSTVGLHEPLAEKAHEAAWVTNVRNAALRLWRQDKAAADRFLKRPHPLLGGRAPLAVARESPAGAKRVLKLIRAAGAGVAV